MRGGDRLVNECSWMSGICFSFYHSTYCCGVFKRSPPLISLFCQSVPKCRLPKNPASPRGKPRTQKPLVITIQRASQLRGFRVAKLATPTGCSGNHWLATTNEVHSLSLALLGSSLREGAGGALRASGSPSWRPLQGTAETKKVRIPYRHRIHKRKKGVNHVH